MEREPAGYRRNVVLLMGNYIAFGVGLAFFSSNTIVPLFLGRLTDSTPLIGLIASIFPLGWMLPQLIAARWIAGREDRKPFLVYLSMGAPLVYATLAGFMFSTDPDAPDRLLPIFVAGAVIVGAVDGLIGVPWLDFFGKAVPLHLRGRVMGWQEAIYALFSVGVGALISHILGEKGPPFPDNFAWLAAGASASFFIALLFFVPLVEPKTDGPRPRQPAWSEYAPMLRDILRADRPFVMMTAVRLLGGMSGLALPFYVIYATTELGIPASAAGLYLSVEVVGSAIGSLLLGYLYDRYGSRLIIRTIATLSLAAPALALLLPLAGLSGPALQWAYAAIFLTFGVSGNSPAAVFIGYTNFIFDHSRPADRPAYLGLSNTLQGPIALAPVLGGWLVQWTNYQTLFAVTAAVLVLASLLSGRLPEPRRAGASAD